MIVANFLNNQEWVLIKLANADIAKKLGHLWNMEVIVLAVLQLSNASIAMV